VRLWELKVDGKVQPPVSETVVLEGIRDGKLSRSTLARRDGKKKWRKLADCPDFASAFKFVPIPPGAFLSSGNAKVERAGDATMRVLRFAGVGIGIVIIVAFANGLYQCEARNERDAMHARELAARELVERRERAANEALLKAQREQERLQDEKRKVDLKAIDESRTPQQQAEIAIASLNDTSSGIRSAVCNARKILATIPASAQNDQLVLQAITLLKSKELVALREVQQEFEKHRMLLCNDGTQSPTCRCGQRRNGCCSYHKGIAGCEPLPTSISCP